MPPLRSLCLLPLVLTVACVSHPAAPDGDSAAPPDDYGVLLMAHGGAPEWNAGVLSAVEPLRDQFKLEVAFGMADAVSIQAAVDRLEERGVERVGVVRLFISGESWLERTGQILGTRAGAPPRPAESDSEHGGGHSGHSMEFWRATSEASFALSTQGLAEADGMGAVLADRARALSGDPQREDVLILAHGPGDDAENERWIAYIAARAEAAWDGVPFRRVEVMTLREDWPEKRTEAEHRIREFVERASSEGGRAIVIPFRVHGFGPYEGVLEGLEYVSDGRGLLPHPNVTHWIEAQATELERGEFVSQVE